MHIVSLRALSRTKIDDATMRTFLPFCILLVFSAPISRLNAQEVHEAHADHSEASGHAHAVGEACGSHDADADVAFSPGDLALHHIADANAVHIFGDLYLPLPMMLYAPGQGWTMTTSAAFKPHHHGNGTVAKDGYVLVHGNVMRVKDYVKFPKGIVEVGEPTHDIVQVGGKPKTIYYVKVEGTCFALEPKSTLDGGFMGGGLTSFYDFSITRNVFTMLLVCGLLFFLFRSVARAYMARDGQAPKGLQSLMEPLVTFIRDEVAKPNIGHHYERYMPYLLTVFFFILGLNLFGQLPFFPGSANVTGSLSVTLVLALITFLMTNLTANRNYWEHVLWMPGVPAVLKVLIMTPVEVLGVFLKPFTLMLRLFANITAGHIVIISFVSLIFIFGKAGESVSGSIIGVAGAVPLTLFMMALELLVAFLQAYIFTMLSAVYFGMANEEAHH
jgi:F-type H+-transporting ATPase subunit a